MITSDGLEIELILQTRSSMGRITSMTFCIQPFLKSHTQATALHAEAMAQLSPFAALTKTTNLCNNLQTVTYIIQQKCTVVCSVRSVLALRVPLSQKLT